MGNYSLQLNLLIAKGDVSPFIVYRKRREQNERTDPKRGVFAYDLPERLTELGIRGNYSVSLKPREGFEPFEISPGAKIDLTRRVLFEALKLRCATVCAPNEYLLPEDSFTREVAFILKEHPEGREVIALQPYYLGVTKQFGFLVDFHFEVKPGITFSRRIQQLSLSLDENYRRNLDRYADRLEKIQTWIRRYHQKLFPIALHGSETPIEIGAEFLPIGARQLRPKTYVVGRKGWIGIESGVEPPHSITEREGAGLRFEEQGCSGAKGGSELKAASSRRTP